MGNIGSIQCLRGIAAAGVVIFHEFEDIARYSSAGLDQVDGRVHVLGNTGVDIFFCVSGVIMVVIIARDVGAGRRREFALRRAIRIVPTYWLLTVLTYIARIIKVERMPAEGFGHGPPLSWSYLLKSLLFIPMHHGGQLVYPVVSAGWTLSYEVLFYSIVLTLLGLPPRLVVAIVAALFTLLAAIGAILQPMDAEFRFVTDPLLLEFVLGMCVGLVFLDPHRPGPVAGVVCILCGLAMLVLTQNRMIDTQVSRLLLRGIPAALLVLGFVCLEAVPNLFACRPLLALGDCSYSLYLTHELVLFVVNRAVPAGTSWPPLLVAWFGVAVSLAVGWLFFLWVERPLNRTLSHSLGSASRPWRPAGMGAHGPASLLPLPGAKGV